MFFQIKAIRKGTKPPIWRRALIPSNITFAQMAVILEKILEMTYSDQFEFEFYMKKDRIIEWHEEDEGINGYNYDYLNGPDTFINEWMMNEKSFTFRIKKSAGNQNKLPEYRVEIEKLVKDARYKENGTEVILNWPVIIKEKLPLNDEFWTDAHEINARLKEECFLCETEAEYLYFAEILEKIEEHCGIGFCEEMVNRDIHNKKSADTMLKEITEQYLHPMISEKMQELKEKLGYDGESGDILVNESESRQVFEEMAMDILFSAKEHIEEVVEKETGRVKSKKIVHECSLKEWLQGYTKQELIYIAEETGLKVASSDRKDKILNALTAHMLKPDTMQTQLLLLEEEELDAFEKAIEQGTHRMTEEEWGELEAVYDMDYIVAYRDNTVVVPKDVAWVYLGIRGRGYRDFHKKADWLLKCLKMAAIIHVTAPVKVLYRLYRQKKEVRCSFEEFLKILEKLPDRINPCQIIDGKVISKEAVREQIYRRIEERQRDVEYYIPTMNEILSYVRDNYPSCEPAYQRVWNFFKTKLHIAAEECDELCQYAFWTSAVGGALSDFVEYMDEKNICFEREEQAEEFAAVMMDAHNNTRMFELRGHTPNEIHSYYPVLPKGKRPTIVPMSSMAADMLEQGREQLAEMGVIVDTEANSDVISAAKYKHGLNGTAEKGARKIYPNDSCPCGSGKKYKKCCGRKS